MVIHDTECPYWDQVSLNNTNQPTNKSARYNIFDSLYDSLELCTKAINKHLSLKNMTVKIETGSITPKNVLLCIPDLQGVDYCTKVCYLQIDTTDSSNSIL